MKNEVQEIRSYSEWSTIEAKKRKRLGVSSSGVSVSSGASEQLPRVAKYDARAA